MAGCLQRIGEEKTMIIGVIDIGSNTVRLAVYDSENLEVIKNGVDYAGLIAYVDDGEISTQGKKVLCSAVSKMKRLAQDAKCDKIIAFATASLRDITDKENLILEVLQRTGIKMEIISGEEEAQYDYLGLKLHYNIDSGATFDLGGGSAQLITFKDGQVMVNISKKIGALKLYKTFVKATFPTAREEEKIREYVRGELSEFQSEKNEYAFAMGGAASAMKKLYRAIFGVKKEEFTIEEVKSFMNVPENTIKAVIPERLYTIRPAIIAILEICRVLKTDRIKCVTCGVRDGVIYEIVK